MKYLFVVAMLFAVGCGGGDAGDPGANGPAGDAVVNVSCLAL